MVAILEDRSRFRKTLFFPRLLPRIYVPLPPEMRAFNEPDTFELFAKTRIFDFCRWIEEGEVALYKEA